MKLIRIRTVSPCERFHAGPFNDFVGAYYAEPIAEIVIEGLEEMAAIKSNGVWYVPASGPECWILERQFQTGKLYV